MSPQSLRPVMLVNCPRHSDRPKTAVNIRQCAQLKPTALTRPVVADCTSVAFDHQYRADKYQHHAVMIEMWYESHHQD